MRSEELINYLQARVEALSKENEKLTNIINRKDELHKSLQ